MRLAFIQCAVIMLLGGCSGASSPSSSPIETIPTAATAAEADRQQPSRPESAAVVELFNSPVSASNSATPLRTEVSRSSEVIDFHAEQVPPSLTAPPSSPEDPTSPESVARFSALQWASLEFLGNGAGNGAWQPAPWHSVSIVDSGSIGDDFHTRVLVTLELVDTNSDETSHVVLDVLLLPAEDTWIVTSTELAR